MTMPFEQLEDELCEHFRRQLQQYSLAIRIADQLQRELNAGLEADESLRRLGSILDDVARSDAKMRVCKQQWESQHGRLGTELHDVLGDVETCLRQLIGHIRESENIARACKDRLQPQVLSEVLAHRMRDAYANTVKDA